MYVRPTSTLLLSGMLTPEIRAMCGLLLLALALLVPRVLADHENDATAPNDLAFLTHRLDRCPYLHGFLAIVYWKRRPCRPQETGQRARSRLAQQRRTPLRPIDVSNGSNAADLTRRQTADGRRSSPSLRSAVCGLPSPHAATFASFRCQGVSIRGPSGVMAMVCSKWLVSVPSSE